MAPDKGSLHTVVEHLARALAPLAQAVSDLENFQVLMLQLGWEVKSLPAPYTALAQRVGEVSSAVDVLGDTPDLTQVLDLLDKVRGVYVAIQALSEAPEGVDAAAFLSEIGERLFELLLVEYLAEQFHSVYSALEALRIIVHEDHEATPLRPGFIRSHILFEEIPQVISDPTSIPRRVYGWGTQDLDFDLLARHLLEFLSALGVLAGLESHGAGLDLLAEPEQAETVTRAARKEVRIILFDLDIAGQPVEIALTVSQEPAEGTHLRGVVLQPLIPQSIGEEFPIDDSFTLRVRAGTDLASQLHVVFRPNEVLARYPFQPEAELPSAGFGVALEYRPEAVRLLLGSPAATRLEVQGALLSIDLDARAGDLEVRLAFALAGLQLVLAAGDQDSFLGELLGGQDVTAPLPLTVQWSNKTGIGFVGGTGFQVSLPGNLRFGPVTLQQIQLALSTTRTPDHAPDLILEAGASLGGQLGPVAFSVDNVGLRLVSRFTDGNAGPFDIGLGFKPPNGVGLSIDAAVVTGGGFLYFDVERGQYAGAVQLNLEDGIAVKAFGLIATRLPDGSKGYSLLALITAEGFKPIPLPLGFKLTGIGGLLAINRTFDEDVLRAGLKNRTLDSVMFPQDPIRNAPQILSSLNKVFPPAIDHHLFGPMAQITWGTPPLITADLAVVLEFGVRLRLLILAQVVAILPRRENDLVRLQMDAIGVLNFDQGTAALDATLYDSRLLKKFVLTGDMAMRLKWEASPSFALAIGGLHPAFNPPPNFPKLERIALNLSAGDNPRFRCEAYFALTSNTVQFGARAELYASAAGFSIQGETGFDVLIQLDPFQFLADFYAQVQLKRDSTNLFKVKVEGALAGPRPLHIKAKATFEVLWMDVSIRVDKTLVAGERPPPPEPIDVLPRLKEALGDPGNWIGRLPDGQRPMVTLRAKPGAPTEVLLHPLGTLTVKQGVVPLNLDISRFGQATPAGARRFTISSISLGGQNQTTQSVKDFFAPAQFFEMSDDEKLSRPSFEPMAAGVSIGSDGFVFTADDKDWLEAESIEFETIIVDKQKNESRRSGPEDLYELSPEFLGKQALFGAAGDSDLRRTGKAKYRTTRVAHTLAKEGWSIVATDDLTVQPVPGIEAGRPASYSEAAQALRKMEQEDPTKAGGLKVLRLSEVRAID